MSLGFQLLATWYAITGVGIFTYVFMKSGEKAALLSMVPVLNYMMLCRAVGGFRYGNSKLFSNGYIMLATGALAILNPAAGWTITLYLALTTILNGYVMYEMNVKFPALSSFFSCIGFAQVTASLKDVVVGRYALSNVKVERISSRDN